MKKVLIVDDEIMIASDLALRMKSIGYDQVTIAFTADEAKEILRNKNIDLIFIDLSLHNTDDGISLAKHIQQLDSKIPFIYISTKSTDSYNQKIQALNPDAILLKPFVDYNINQAIEQVVKNKGTKNLKAVTKTP